MSENEKNEENEKNDAILSANLMKAFFHHGFYEAIGDHHLIRIQRQLFVIEWEA